MPPLPTPVEIAILAMLLGLVGTVVPLVPGLPIILVCAVAYYTWAGAWTAASTAVVAILAVLTLVGMSAEWWLGPANARRGGASCLTSVLAAAAGIVGFFVLPFVGAILLPIGVVLVVEWLRMRDSRRAGRAAGAYFVGWLSAMAFELVAGALMIAIFWWHAAR